METHNEQLESARLVRCLFSNSPNLSFFHETLFFVTCCDVYLVTYLFLRKLPLR
jgi:hypothetical protein